MLKSVENQAGMSATEYNVVPERNPAHRLGRRMIERARREIAEEIERTGGQVSRAALQEIARRSGCWIVWRDGT